MIYPIKGWSEITQYDVRRKILIANLFDTMWLTRCPRPMEITYDQGSGFIGHEFRKSLIERECGINSKPSTSGNPTSNVILERVHQALRNLMRNFNITQTYVNKDDSW